MAVVLAERAIRVDLIATLSSLFCSLLLRHQLRLAQGNAKFSTKYGLQNLKETDTELRHNIHNRKGLQVISFFKINIQGLVIKLHTSFSVVYMNNWFICKVVAMNKQQLKKQMTRKYR